MSIDVMVRFLWLYVNSWGKAKRRNLTAKELQRAAAPLLLGAGGTMQNSVAEAGEVANAKANTLQGLGFVVAAFCETVEIGAVKCVKDVFAPIMHCSYTGLKLR